MRIAQSSYTRFVEREKLKLQSLLNKLYTNQHCSYCTPLAFLTYINEIQLEIDDIYDDFIFGRYENLFPIKAYMNIYNKIHINCDDKILFCYYRDYDRPYILAIDEKTATRIDKDGILSVDDDMGDLNNPETPFEKFINKHSARLFMVADDTLIGYTQLLHFHEFGNNFSVRKLFNGRKYVVISLEQIIKQVDLWENCQYQHPYKKEMDEYDSSYALSKDESNRRKTLIQDFEIARRGLKPSDIEPKIEMTDDYCTIEWVECYNNHGLYRSRYQISRKDCNVARISKVPILSISPTFKD